MSAGFDESTLIGSARFRSPTPPLGQFSDQVQGVPDGASQPVKGVHHDHVAFPGVPGHRPQPGRSTVDPDFLSK